MLGNALREVAGGTDPETQRQFFRVAGVTLNARRGLRRVPGSDDTAVPAMLHGGEMVLPARQARQMEQAGGTGALNITINNNVTVEDGGSNGAGVAHDFFREVTPRLERQITEIIERQGRFGRLEVSSRSIRGVAN